MILCQAHVLRFGAGWFMTNSGCNGVTWVVKNPYLAMTMTLEYAEHEAAKLAKERWPFEGAPHVDPAFVEIVRLDGCGCCGKWGDLWHTSHGVRCEKHKGRNPCLIEGCGRTFPGKSGEQFLCGTHFREAPKYMRDRFRMIERKAKKFGWTEKLDELHGMAWRLIVRSVQSGRQLDVDEINHLMGWAE